MPAPHPLDRPVWSALSGRQSALAEGGPRALRLAADIGPFAAMADTSPESLAALAALAPAEGNLWLVEAGELPPLPGLAVIGRAICHQMVARALTAGQPIAHPAIAHPIVPLGEGDAPAMHALATLTRPGPFLAGTHRLGGFIGVKVDGRLVAMAGERMKPGRFTEVSGVCTHPDYRGRGLAGALMRAVAHAMLDRGETPFLHVYAENGGAIALYETLGFAFHQAVTLTIVARA